MIRHVSVTCLAVCLMLPICAEQPAQPPTLDLSKSQANPSAQPGTRNLLLLPLPAEPAWQDMAFLAAVPAAAVANNGAPSLIALDAAGTLTPEIQDYIRRYRPETTYLIGGTVNLPDVNGRPCTLLKAASADEAACALSRKFWPTSAAAVICSEENYEAALLAAPLAARLRAPMFFASAKGFSQATQQELKRLELKELIVVGKPDGLPPLKPLAERVAELVGAREVMEWTRQRGLKVSYLTALNPLDRSKTIIKKLSLAGALLAAGRDGVTAPLPLEVRWKVPFTGAELKGEPPAGTPKSEAKPKAGRIALGGPEHAFVLTGKPKERDLRVSIDLDGDGQFTGAHEGPFGTGDTVKLDGKTYVVTLGTENGVGKADVRLTWPPVENVVADLRRFYEALGAAPEHLCLTGFPDAVPQAIMGKGGIVEEMTSDLPFANADEDPFAEIGVSRIVAENASFATLYASRVLTYASLLDPEWQDRACQARWENTCQKQFENVGFEASYRHTTDNLKWIEPPAQGKKGKRAQTFEQDSPLTRCAALVHMDHSWWHELGHTFAWDAEVLLAPVVVESGGCLTAVLDKEPDCRSVIARLFRKGAAAFSGNSRPGCAPQELQRMEFWNGVLLRGETIGQAHRRSINSALVTVLNRKDGPGGAYGYQLRIRTQFGDPAFTMRVPSPPRSAPAKVTVDRETVTVHAPAQWWPVKMVVPEDWKKWANKDLYVLRGAGTYALRSWCGEEYDREETFMTAEFTTRRRVAKIEQLQKPPAPLGWNDKFYVDEHADGSRTYRWAVRLADFDQIKGSMVNAVERIEYRVVYE